MKTAARGEAIPEPRTTAAQAATLTLVLAVIVRAASRMPHGTDPRHALALSAACLLDALDELRHPV